MRYAHMKEQSFGRVLVCLFRRSLEWPIFYEFFCEGTPRCREFSASPGNGLRDFGKISFSFSAKPKIIQ